MKRQSPYGVTSFGRRFMGYYVHRPILPHETDLVTTITDHRYHHRPDLLAHTVYGDHELWWVFGVRNQWDDPIHDLVHGKTLYIPHPDRIMKIV